jgi:thiol:disulfide interchange protein DsbD
MKALHTVARWLAGASLLLAQAGHAQGLSAVLAGGKPSPSVVVTEQVRAELLAHAPQGIGPGRKVWLGLQISHQSEWHTYWKNPGDSGLPTTLKWTLPAGVQAGEIAWPTPKKFPLGDLANYGYEAVVLLPVPIQIGQDWAGESLQVQLQANWLVCRRECIPQEGQFALQLLTQILVFLIIDEQIRVAGHPELKEMLHLHAMEQLLAEGMNDRGQKHEIVRAAAGFVLWHLNDAR